MKTHQDQMSARPNDFERIQQECEHEMMNYIRAKRLGRAQRAANHTRREKSRADRQNASNDV